MEIWKSVQIQVRQLVTTCRTENQHWLPIKYLFFSKTIITLKIESQSFEHGIIRCWKSLTATSLDGSFNYIHYSIIFIIHLYSLFIYIHYSFIFIIHLYSYIFIYIHNAIFIYNHYSFIFIIPLYSLFLYIHYSFILTHSFWWLLGTIVWWDL